MLHELTSVLKLTSKQTLRAVFVRAWQALFLRTQQGWLAVNSLEHLSWGGMHEAQFYQLSNKQL